MQIILLLVSMVMSVPTTTSFLKSSKGWAKGLGKALVGVSAIGTWMLGHSVLHQKIEIFKFESPSANQVFGKSDKIHVSFKSQHINYSENSQLLVQMNCPNTNYKNELYSGSIKAALNMKGLMDSNYETFYEKDLSVETGMQGICQIKATRYQGSISDSKIEQSTTVDIKIQ
eukprot:NODE_311_length_10039_cov_0.864487.p8 type:complete len:172 gc:universal NODE_311_length_10039_cov_0.864487:262-777(+)